MTSVETFTSECRAKGIKLTGQRRVIAQIMLEGQDHPNAEQIQAVASRQLGRISLATVYRTMRVLRDAGMVIEHAFPDGRCHYELAGRPHHDHLIDAESGAILEFCDPEIERLQQAIALRLGYRLTGHRLELYGVRARWYTRFRYCPPPARTACNSTLNLPSHSRSCPMLNNVFA